MILATNMGLVTWVMNRNHYIKHEDIQQRIFNKFSYVIIIYWGCTVYCR